MHDIDLKLLIGMHRNVNVIDKKTAGLAYAEDLTIGQFAVLEVLHSKGDLPIGNVRDCILSSVGTISVIVKNLEQRGLVKRLPHENDRRICILSITEKGETVITKVIPKNTEMIRETFSVLTAVEKDELLRIMKKIGRRKY